MHLRILYVRFNIIYNNNNINEDLILFFKKLLEELGKFDLSIGIRFVELTLILSLPSSICLLQFCLKYMRRTAVRPHCSISEDESVSRFPGCVRNGASKQPAVEIATVIAHRINATISIAFAREGAPLQDKRVVKGKKRKRTRASRFGFQFVPKLCSNAAHFNVYQLHHSQLADPIRVLEGSFFFLFFFLFIVVNYADSVCARSRKKSRASRELEYLSFGIVASGDSNSSASAKRCSFRRGNIRRRRVTANRNRYRNGIPL